MVAVKEGYLLGLGGYVVVFLAEFLQRGLSYLDFEHHKHH